MLDLFCGAGGAAKGYQRAGFYVVGVDTSPQPNYCGDEFLQDDALAVLANYPWWDEPPFVAIHASPPCQHYSDLAKRNGNADEHPDLIATVRELLLATGLPYVIENVEGAPLRNPAVLCGVRFSELAVIRHRLFETNWPLTAPLHTPHPLVWTADKRKRHYGLKDQATSFVSVNGGGNSTVARAREAMGIGWPMTKAEVNEAIPPAYTHYIEARLALWIEGQP